MKKAHQPEQGNRRTQAIAHIQNGTLPELFFKENSAQKPDGISEAAWKIVLKAESLIVHFEIKNLELLLLQYLDAVKRAEGCKCFQCRKRARIITELLEEELERLQHDITKENQDKRVEGQIIAAETAYGIEKLKEAKLREMQAQFHKREREWLQRTKRIRQLIEKVVKHNSEPDKGLTPEERAEIKTLLEEARERRKDWAWKNW